MAFMAYLTADCGWAAVIDATCWTHSHFILRNFMLAKEEKVT